MLINPLDKEALSASFRSAEPFPHIVIENFLAEGFVDEVVEAYPNFDDAWAKARETRNAFNAVNEKLKIQISESDKFPEPVKRLHDALASEEFRSDLAEITGIPNLLADPAMRGGGMHLTGPRGRLDVHIDFNMHREQKLHRRLNILIYLNREWKQEWGGSVELWDREVKRCVQSLQPVLNRCVIFETSEISFHGVEPVTCPDGVRRISFAGYYYTKEPPANWDGEFHSTVFKPRPNEFVRQAVLGGIESVGKRVKHRVDQADRLIKRLSGRGEDTAQ